MTPFIAYYRVSTDKQGKSGLGLDAQASAVAAFVAGRGEILHAFTEIESGKKNDRPQLAEALALCRRHKAKLIIAKLDRLARNVHFISGLIVSPCLVSHQAIKEKLYSSIVQSLLSPLVRPVASL